MCSHGRAALCAWDLRCMAFPVHEARLDHSCHDMPLRLLPAYDTADNQSLYLAAHADWLLGQAGNGAAPTAA